MGKHVSRNDCPLSPRLQHAHAGFTQSEILLIRSFDQIVENGILKNRPPIGILGHFVQPARDVLERAGYVGAYLELEVVLRPHQTVKDGAEVAQSLLDKLSIPPEHLESRAYIDLLEEAS